jgi:hypothetical protein
LIFGQYFHLFFENIIENQASCNNQCIMDIQALRQLFNTILINLIGDTVGLNKAEAGVIECGRLFL